MHSHFVGFVMHQLICFLLNFQIELLLQEADVEQDFKIDHVLGKACAPVIETACQPGQVQK